MTSRAPVPATDGLSMRQRLCLFHGKLSAEEALSLQAADLTADLLIRQCVHPSNVIAAGLGPRALRELGFADARQLRALGFDALHLADSKFAAEANAAFGADNVREAFVESASDAVCVAGSEAVPLLGISTNDLLLCCAGAPVEAFAVLQQLPSGASLHGVSPQTLLDTGLRKAKLGELGYSLTSIISQTGARSQELGKLGFGLL
jgi:hypothetical protein